MKLLIVNYHYIREEKTGRGIFPVTLQEFLNQIDELSKYYVFISQEDLVSFIKSGKIPQKNMCLLTFDDGLKEQMDAFDLLMSKGVPGVFFVSPKTIHGKYICDVHKGHIIRCFCSEHDLQAYLDNHFGFSNYSFDADFIKNKYIYDSIDTGRIKFYINYVLSLDQKNQMTDELFSEYIEDYNAFARNLYMDCGDVKQIAKNGMLGSHGLSHVPLAGLKKKEIEFELLESKEQLENITDCLISGISYPFGDVNAVNSSVLSNAKENYNYGLTTELGLNGIQDLIEAPMALKRISTNLAPGGSNTHASYYP